MKSITNSNLILYFFLILSMFVGLIYGEDTGGSGSISDFKATWVLIERPFEIYSLVRENKFPLHYYIGMLIYEITNNIFLYKLFYVVITCFTPIIFFKILELKYPNVNKNNLFLFAMILLILPHVRSAAIWPNTQITAIFFFLLTLYNFVKIEISNNFFKINKNLILTLIFAALTVYTRQIYAIFYLYLVFFFFKNYSLKNFIKIIFIVLILAIPGLITIYIHPIIATSTFTYKFQNTILINLSIISFYLIPFFFISAFFRLYNFKLNKEFFLLNLFSFLLVLLLAHYSEINIKMYGGFFVKLSLFLFSNLNFFFVTSFIGMILIYLFCKKNLENIILSALIIFGLASYTLQQKYFEPMMILLFFLVYKNEDTKKFLENFNAVFITFLYYFLYFSVAVINNIFKIKEKMIMNL